MKPGGRALPSGWRLTSIPDRGLSAGPTSVDSCFAGRILLTKRVCSGKAADGLSGGGGIRVHSGTAPYPPCRASRRTATGEMVHVSRPEP